MTTSHDQLKNQVQHIADTINNGYDGLLNDCDEPMTVWDYATDALDIEYILNSQKEVLGARFLVAFGGPNIWIDTRNNTVEGYWWNERYTASINSHQAAELTEVAEQIFYC